MSALSVELLPSLPGLRSRHWRLECRTSNVTVATAREALQSALPRLDPASWPERFAWGGLYLNGRRLKDLDQILPIPWRLDYYEALYDVGAAEREFPRIDRSAIVFSDDDLIVVYKPAGLPCLPGCEQQRFHVAQSLRNLGFGPKFHFPSRLDTAAQGLVPVACSNAMERTLQRHYERRSISKSYLLLVGGLATWEGVCVRIGIDRSPEHSILRIASFGGKTAMTEFRRVRLTGEQTVVEATPITGRTHQLRVHCQVLGLPVCGDTFYGGAPAGELGLVCAGLKLPYGTDTLEVRAPERLLPAWAKSA